VNVLGEYMKECIDRGAVSVSTQPEPLIASYGDVHAEHKALDVGPALVDRSYRALLEVTGSDRASWLHNFVTHHVKELRPGDGNYAFVCNVQGRIQDRKSVV